MKKYYNEKISEQLGLDCFELSIIEEIKSYFNIKQEINESANEELFYKMCKNTCFKKEFGNRVRSMPVKLYFNVKAYCDKYIYYADGYEWDLDEEILKTEDKIDTLYLDSMPFIEYEILNIKVKYNNKWKRIIKTQKNIMLL